jgi:hypothetical protein
MLAIVLAACGATQENVAPAGSDASSDGAAATLDGEALVSERCTQCHQLARVETAKKTSDEWKATVERMVSLGAQLDEAEQAAVIDYLAEAYPK